VLWQETFVIYPRILAETSSLIVGPMVTNPGTRDWSVIASMFATLNASTATGRSAASGAAIRRGGTSGSRRSPCGSCRPR